MDLNLSGKVALVCGASQGIGEASARALAAQGASIVALARSEDKLQKLVESLPGEGHRVLAVDLEDRKHLSSQLDSLLAEIGGPIEILICNTGGPKGGPLAEAEEEAFSQAFENHVLVNTLLVKKLLPGMKDKNYGRVINIISTSVKIPIPNLGMSNTIRGAVASWAKTLSFELAPSGVTVNNVLPGYTETPRLEALISGAAKRLGKTEDEVIQMWKNNVPMKRFAKPEEVASAVGYLASPAAAYINGVSLPVDGGRTGCL